MSEDNIAENIQWVADTLKAPIFLIPQNITYKQIISSPSLHITIRNYMRKMAKAALFIQNNHLQSAILNFRQCGEVASHHTRF
jgi:hypothetical protein